ncbi:flagellar basal body-associated FliL family protein [Derxia gummosa]|uniref:Flagellar protein FliL n=1 Tax=Derxia gummosa DSM 723 TaxID=1121388 RepID=A0A8B6X5Z0_9BURK|nr:flagellar basal body-associated FliL family protein [Derxia gummosa]
MATAAATPDTGDAPKKSKKMLFIIVGVVLLLAIGGAAAFMLLGKKHDEEGGDGHGEAAAAGAHGDDQAESAGREYKKKSKPRLDPKHPPTFTALEVFTVNLADRDRDRYLQAGITVQLDEEAAGAELKAFMPAIRHEVLLLLSSLTSADVVTAEDKEILAHRIQNTINKALGYAPPPRKKRKNAPEPQPEEEEDIDGPVVGVNFTVFVIQ